MSQVILLLDYEPRTAARVTEALAPLGCPVITAKDVDSAVAACANAEPQVVLTTSVLPRLKVEDAIMQLRARAGLRHTPFLVLMSGYTGQDPVADAHKLGAQDIVAKPFSAEELLAHVRALMTRRADAHAAGDTRAEVLEALRRAGGSKDAGTVTAKDLFGDLLAEEPAATRKVSFGSRTGPSGKQPAGATPDKATLAEVDAEVERVLADTLAEVQQAPTKVRKEPEQVSVDKLLEDTLSGLEISKPKAAARPAERRPEPPVQEVAEPVSHPTEAPPPSPPPVALPLEPPPMPPRAPKPTSAPDAAVPEVERVPGPLPSGTPFGQYELIETIATGGMAEVYRARMSGVEGFQKIVAIKRILPHLSDNHEFVTMFVDEAKLAAQLQHPNIVHIYDLGKIERSYYIAMEYIDGRDLRSILKTLEDRQARLPLGLALFITSRLAAGLDYAHHKRDLQGTAMALVHRDVSPQNVLISYDGDIKLCDFGIAKAASKASHTRAGALKGKLQYMSPEQAWGRDIDGRSDIFSLGLVLYEMLTGRKGFAGDSEFSILEQVRSPHLIPPRELDPAIPPEVERVVMKALRENRDERYQTATELAADLDVMLQLIRPTPGASELGAFLAELVGHERLVSTTPVPTPRPAVTPPPRPAPAPPPPKPAPHPPAAEVVHAEPPPLLTTPQQTRVALIAGIALVVLAAVAGVLYFSKFRRAGPGASAEATPAPETIEMAREVAQQEVDKQTQALRERLSNEILRPTPVLPARRPTAPPDRGAAVGTSAAAPAAVAQVATAAPTVPVQEPTAVPTEAPPTPFAATPTAEPAPAPEQPAVREGDLVEMGADVVPPQAIYKPALAYPALAARQRVEGTVLLDVLIDENGEVRDVKLVRGVKPDLGLDAAAVSTARRWRYTPATKGGVKVKLRITQAITFALKP